MAIPDLRNQYLELFAADPATLSKVIAEQVMELRGCKQEEVAGAVAELRLVFASADKVTPMQLELFRRSFTKMRIDFPQDILELIASAE